MRTPRTLSFLWLPLLLLALAPAPIVHADDSPEAPVKPAPAPEAETAKVLGDREAWSDDAFLQKHLAAACDAVEVASGARFQKRPTVRVTTRDEMVDILMLEMGATFQRLMDIDAKGARSICEAVAASLMAKYEPAKRVVHILPENMDRLTRLVERPEVMNKGVLRVVMAHECAHALDFDRWPALDTARQNRPTEEGVQAIGAVLEGHAQFIAERVAKTWKLEAEFKAFSDLIVAKVPNADVSSRMLADVMAAQVRFAYIKGHEFFNAVYAAKGREGVEAVMANPPETVNLIERPALYLDPSLRSGPFDPAPVLAALDKLIQDKGWQDRVVAIQKTQMEAIFGPLGAERIEKPMGQFEGGSARVGAAGPGRMAVLNIDWWRDEDAAKERLKMTRLLLIEKEQQLLEEGKIRVVRSETQQGAGKGDAFNGFTHAKTLQIYGTEQKLSLQVVQTGRFVLELTLVGVGIPREQQDAILAQATAALKAAGGKKSPPEDE